MKIIVFIVFIKILPVFDFIVLILGYSFRKREIFRSVMIRNNN